MYIIQTFIEIFRNFQIELINIYIYSYFLQEILQKLNSHIKSSEELFVLILIRT